MKERQGRGRGDPMGGGGHASHRQMTGLPFTRGRLSSNSTPTCSQASIMFP